MGIEVSRRAALHGLAAAVAGRGPSGEEAVARPSVTAATRNLYLGADLFRLFVDREGSRASIIGTLLEQVDASAVERRMNAIAAGLAAARPDVIGLQEAAHIRTERPSDGTRDGEPDAGTTRYDLLALLRGALADRGLAYDVVAVSENTDAEFPAVVDGDRVDVRLTDRDAVLVRPETTAVDAARSATFDAAFTVPVGDGFTLTRGYAAAAVRVGGRALTAATTHLEPASASVRTAQAEEFRAALSEPSTAIVLGDLNDGPATDDGAYETLAGPFEDAYAAAPPDAGGDGDTCCFPPSLRAGDPETALTGRYDVVLSRGLRPAGARRVGVDPSARVEFDGDLLWPSDHAGVVATFGADGTGTATSERGTVQEEPGTTATPRSTPTASSASPTPSPSPATGSRTATEERPATGSRTATETEATTTTGPGIGALPAVVAAFVAGARLATRSDAGSER